MVTILKHSKNCTCGLVRIICTTSFFKSFTIAYKQRKLNGHFFDGQFNISTHFVKNIKTENMVSDIAALNLLEGKQGSLFGTVTAYNTP